MRKRLTILISKIYSRVKIFCPYIDEQLGFLTVTDVIWINFSETDVIYSRMIFRTRRTQ